jgi:DNA repair protein RAD16
LSVFLLLQDSLSKEEDDFYKSLYLSSRVTFDTYTQSGTVLHNYAHIFDLLTRLRQSVDHPYLVKAPKQEDDEDTARVCALCQEVVEAGEEGSGEVAQAKCGHVFHKECYEEYIRDAPDKKKVGCPTCFSPLTVLLQDAPDKKSAMKKVSKRFLDRIDVSKFQSSTKIEAVMEEYTRMIAANKDSKCVIFSQFGRFLELVEYRMRRGGVAAVRLSGSMSMQQKADMISAFQTDPTVKVLLLSLKAGGEGLNLQAADHIFMLDPWWNPASEQQAMQRAHRIGQTRAVKAVRFITSGTVEDKVLQLQEKKQLVFESCVGGSDSAMRSLTDADLRFLFS